MPPLADHPQISAGRWRRCSPPICATDTCAFRFPRRLRAGRRLRQLQALPRWMIPPMPIGVRHRRTWFVGVDALPTCPMAVCPAVRRCRRGDCFPARSPRLHRPVAHGAALRLLPRLSQRDDDESESQQPLPRQTRCGPCGRPPWRGPERRRHLREFHDLILGLPLNAASADAAPLVVWRGSHVMMQKLFTDALAHLAPEEWGAVDLTDLYQQCGNSVRHLRARGAAARHRARRRWCTASRSMAWRRGANTPPHRITAG